MPKNIYIGKKGKKTSFNENSNWKKMLQKPERFDSADCFGEKKFLHRAPLTLFWRNLLLWCIIIPLPM